jgi:septum formation protein
MAAATPIRLILASDSAARRDLLTRAGYQFKIHPSGIEEPTDNGFSRARAYVQHVAWLKAAAVASSLDDEPAVILSADTVGWFNDRAVGKPKDEADARRILRLLAGTEHELWTGVCLWRHPDHTQVAWQELSRVSMHRFTDPELDSYFTTRTWQNCSGAYAIQEENDPYLKVVHGSLTNVIGLPMETLAQMLPLLTCAPIK